MFAEWFQWRSSDLPLAPVIYDPLLQMACRIALEHHEKWDGSGYLRQLQGEAISVEARIVAVADVFDALSSPRPYKPASTSGPKPC